MIRKAKSLETLDELGLSKRTRTHIEKLGLSLEEVVLLGRITAYVIKYGPGPMAPYKVKTIMAQWRKELAVALDGAGFIGGYINPEVFATGRLLTAIFKEPHEISYVDEMTNEFYEQYLIEYLS